MTFYVGQKVVCIDDSNQCCGDDIRWLRKGEVYTLRWVGNYTLYGMTSLCVRLAGVNRGPDRWSPDNPHVFDMPFSACRFRPVVERKTDISIFTEILDRLNGDEPRVREVEHQS